ALDPALPGAARALDPALPGAARALDPALPGAARARGMVDRRMFLAGAGALGLVLATGCGGGGQSGANGKNILGAAFATGLDSDSVLIPGVEQRAPLVLFDAESAVPVRQNPPDSIDVELWFNGTRLSQSKLMVQD